MWVILQTLIFPSRVDEEIVAYPSLMTAGCSGKAIKVLGADNILSIRVLNSVVCNVLACSIS